MLDPDRQSALSCPYPAREGSGIRHELATPDEKEEETMSIKTNIALSLAVILGTASAALAAPKHAVHHHQAAVVHQIPNSAYQAYGSARDAEGAGNQGFGSTSTPVWLSSTA